MKRRVVVTGFGTLNPLGNDPGITWQQVKSGRSGIRTVPQFVESGLKSHIGGQVKEFDPVTLFGRKEARRMDRATQLALAAADQALAHSSLQLTDSLKETTGVMLGSGMGNIGSTIDGISEYIARGPRKVSPFFIPMMLADSPSATVSITFGLRGPNIAILTACAASNNALGEAAKTIERGAADVMLAGGAEAPLWPSVIAGFNASGALSTFNEIPEQACRPFDANRDGFVTSEGATVIILEALDHALSRGATIHAEFLGYGTSADAYHISAPATDGSGAIKAMTNALEDGAIHPTQIDYINAHGTGTALNDKSETLAIKKVFGDHADQVAISSTKSMHGHLLGAAGALEALICIKALNENFVPPTINYQAPDPECDLAYTPNTGQQRQTNMVLSNSFGLGGHNATIVLGRYGRGLLPGEAEDQEISEV